MVSRRGPETHHVVPHHGGGWDVRRGGAERASGHFDTKQQAVDFGRTVSRSQQTELRIHNENGRIAQSDSHGHDPNPPRG
jgi:Uncharacterized protein conserved in bacteria (DUF2188)